MLIDADYYIDAINGNDANDGLTENTPWRSLNKINKDLVVKNETKKIYIKEGNYNSVNDFVRIETSNDDVLNGVLDIIFEQGCIMDGANTADENGFELSGNIVYTTNIIGNGLIIQNYSSVTSSSPNGIGNRGVNILNVYDVNINSCDDGYSSHGNATMNLYRCTANECNKSPFINVQDCNVLAENCTFTEKIGGGTLGLGVVSTQSNVTLICNNTVFIPDSINTAMRAKGVFNNCQIGTLDKSVTIDADGTDSIVLNDCFVNINTDGTDNITMNKCYGKFTVRIRIGGSTDIQNCVIVAPASGQTNIIYSNFNSGDSQTFICNNNIFEMATGFMDINATNAGYLVANNSEFFNNCLFGGISYDTDLVNADTSQTVIVDTLNADPLIGLANTLIQSDYGYVDGSPCIGAGTNGSNIGFED